MEQLSEGGTVAGLFPEAEFADTTVDLQPGDVLIAYTDGLSEATNAAGQEYGLDRLSEVARRSVAAKVAARGLAEQVVKDVRGFTRGAPQHDDLTLVVAVIR